MQKYSTQSISANHIPPLAKQLHKPVKSLNSLGDASLLTEGKRVSIVGSRKFTPYGREVTHSLASDLARAGVTIVSGLALGVDSIAHRACIEVGGKTIAILPSGVNNIYPSSHYQLANNILGKGGLLISEYENDHRPRKYEFIERNRLIASFCDLLIVTEAAESSGSLHTASFALEMGVPIMAVPGNITSPYSTGTNKLILTGAEPLLSSQQVLDFLEVKSSEKIGYIPETEAEEAILQALGHVMTDQELILATKMSASELSTQLTLLEIKGVIRAESGVWQIK